ncbi:MAG: L-rhamnose mutarotase, partial [Chitinophagaceae bacterium]
MRRYCLTLELKNDPHLIQQYEAHHQAVWPEIIDSIKQAGIQSMEIYRLGTRLFMTMEVHDDFS